ncbi:MAG: hypothetical protein A4E74_01540 [Syntrophus sp. PtaB.Bin075]|nr:MAG: hypothetical protein A4E74_01540 [Syntrophus sp. PtaB.Bin075]
MTELNKFYDADPVHGRPSGTNILAGFLNALGLPPTIQAPIRTVTASTTVQKDTDYILLVDATAGAVDLSLPSCLDMAQGRKFSVKKIDATANPVSLIPEGSETIDTAATLVLTKQNEQAVIMNSGTKYQTELFNNPALTYECDALMQYGNGKNFTLATINAALTALGTTTRATLLLRPGTWVIDDDLTFPSNVTVKLPDGVDLQIAAGKNVTFNAPPKIGLYPVFSGPGTVVFGNSSVNVQALWWGLVCDFATDNSASVQHALNSLASAGGYVYIPPKAKWYLKTSDHVLNSAGNRKYECIFPHTATADDEPGVGVNWGTYWKDAGAYTAMSYNGITWKIGTGYVANNPTGVTLVANVHIIDDSLNYVRKFIVNGDSSGSMCETVIAAGFHPALVIDANSNYPIDTLNEAQAFSYRASLVFRANGNTIWRLFNDTYRDDNILAIQNDVIGRTHIQFHPGGKNKYGLAIQASGRLDFSTPLTANDFLGSTALFMTGNQISDMSVSMKCQAPGDASALQTLQTVLYRLTGLFRWRSATGTIQTLTKDGNLKPIRGVSGNSFTTADRNAILPSYVTHGGHNWRCSVSHTSSATDEPGVGANSATFWTDLGAGTGYGAWALSTAYCALETGTMVYDITLGKPVWCKGTGWVDATGTPV